jgi:hypothetical protein
MRYSVLMLVLPLSAAVVFACSDDPPSSSPTKADAGPGGQDAASVDAQVEQNGTTVPVASQLSAKLTAAGFDVNNLKSMAETITEAKTDTTGMRMKGLMEAFSTSLGVKCNFCHTIVGADGGLDFAAASEKKNIASKMWDEFVVKLRFQNNDPLFCDSCHSGTAKMLDRDPGTIAGFMGTNYVGKFKLAKGGMHACSTCHGTPFVAEFIPLWAQGNK